MYLKKYDYKSHPEYDLDGDYIFEHANNVRKEYTDMNSYSKEIIRHFMKIWLYSYRYGIDHWVQELAYNYITEAPRVKPRNKIVSSSLIKKALNDKSKLKDYRLKKTLESILKQYKKFVPRPDYESNFLSRFREDYDRYITLLSDRLVEVTENGDEIEDDDIRDILDDLGLNN